MSMRMTHPQRNRTERTRTRRIATTASPVRTADAATTDDDDRRNLADALDAARQERLSAQRELRRGERERDRAAHALELTLPPAIDEAGRARLRAAHAEASTRVDHARRALDRARSVEDAAAVILANAAENGSRSSRDLAEGLLRLLGSVQPA